MTSSSSPTSARTSLSATCRIPSGSVPAVPAASFFASSGTPKSMIPETPASTASAAAFFSVSRVCCTTPGIAAIGTGSLTPSRTKAGRDEVGGVQPGLGDHPTHDGSGPQPPGPGAGKGSVRRHTSYATPAPPVPLPTGSRPTRPLS